MLENLTPLLAETKIEGEWWAPIVWTTVVFIVILVMGRIALTGMKEKLPKNPITLLGEHVYLFIENMCVSVIGPQGRKYIPFVFTVYMVVLFSNCLGLMGLFAPTATLGVTFGMAVLVVVYVQIEGVRANGPIGYVKHFFGPPLGWQLLPITLLLFVIEVVSEAAKMLSLSLRLFGNISGDEKVGSTLGGLIHVTPTFSVPLQTVLVPLGVFVAIVQALVFTMLTCVYLSMFTSHDEAHEAAH